MKLAKQIKWLEENSNHSGEALANGDVLYIACKGDRFEHRRELSREDFSEMIFRMINKVSHFDKVDLPAEWL